MKGRERKSQQSKCHFHAPEPVYWSLWDGESYTVKSVRVICAADDLIATSWGRSSGPRSYRRRSKSWDGVDALNRTTRRRGFFSTA